MPISRENLLTGLTETVAYHLYNVAYVFAQAQYHRNEADYNTGREWDLTEVPLHIDGIADAFKSWHIMRDQAAAQASLVSMLPSRERRQSERPERRPALTDESKP